MEQQSEELPQQTTETTGHKKMRKRSKIKNYRSSQITSIITHMWDWQIKKQKQNSNKNSSYNNHRLKSQIKLNWVRMILFDWIIWFVIIIIMFIMRSILSKLSSPFYAFGGMILQEYVRLLAQKGRSYKKLMEDVRE